MCTRFDRLTGRVCNRPHCPTRVPSGTQGPPGVQWRLRVFRCRGASCPRRDHQPAPWPGGARAALCHNEPRFGADQAHQGRPVAGVRGACRGPRRAARRGAGRLRRCTATRARTCDTGDTCDTGNRRRSIDGLGSSGCVGAERPAGRGAWCDRAQRLHGQCLHGKCLSEECILGRRPVSRRAIGECIGRYRDALRVAIGGGRARAARRFHTRRCGGDRGGSGPDRAIGRSHRRCSASQCCASQRRASQDSAS